MFSSFMCWPTLIATIYKQLFEEALFPQIKGTFPRNFTEKILFHAIIAMHEDLARQL